MKKEKKMRKKIVGFMVTGALVLALGLVSTPATAELSLGLVGGYYSPNFGKINDDLEKINTALGTDLEFKAAMTYGLVLGYDLGPRFGLRLEYGSFESKTSDTVPDTTPEELVDFKMTVTPLLLSATYGFSPFYVGAGVGSFATKVDFDIHVGPFVMPLSDSDSPTGFVLLAGYRLANKPIFLNVEARYVVGTKAKLEDAGTEVDLSGVQGSLLVGLKI